MTTKPDHLHHHEAVDRIHIVNCMLDDLLMYHPAVVVNPELKAKIVEISKALGEAYQLAGQEWYKALQGGAQ